MPTSVEFPIATSVDDQRVRKQAATYAGVSAASVQRSSTLTSGGDNRGFTGTVYEVGNILLRMDTSIVSSSATVTSGLLRSYIQGRINTNSLSLSGGKYAWDGVSSTDWTYAPESDAFAAVTLASFTSPGSNDVTLASPDSLISRTGYTSIRISVTQLAADAAPTGQNLLDMRMFDYDAANGTNFRPRLVLNWSYGDAATDVALLDFGAFPGATDATEVVSGQTSMGASSAVQVELEPLATPDHTADEHRAENLQVYAGNIQAGTGFTIYGKSTDNTRIYGKWCVRWARV